MNTYTTYTSCSDSITYLLRRSQSRSLLLLPNSCDNVDEVKKHIANIVSSKSDSFYEVNYSVRLNYFKFFLIS